MPLYPVGGGTSLDYGTLPARPGRALSLANLNRVIDYPARDMTITVEAGLRVAALAEQLAAERQWLPLDVPNPETATVGGVVATAWSGPRRYGWGTPRDYVIGISAVDGRGMPFKGGGRVVKNVAGYDFCKLLTGSLGTLGVITQLTFKIRPLPAHSALAVCELRSWNDAERLLAALVHSAATPSAIELLSGPHWQDHTTLGLATAGTVARLAVGVEGTDREVDWMLDRLAHEWRELGVAATHSLVGPQAAELWHDLAEFPAAHSAPLVVKASLLPSRTVEFAELVSQCDAAASMQCHAGNGIVIARFANFEPGDVSRWLVGKLQPAAIAAGGQLIVLSHSLGGLTHQAIWGGVPPGAPWMAKVKSQFDPSGILNPGRFVYAD
jgi:glycolate oxidase FAD binding subunit